MENDKNILECLYEMFENIEPSVILNVYSELTDFDKTVEFLVEINETVSETGNDILLKIFLEDEMGNEMGNEIQEDINPDILNFQPSEDSVENDENWFKNISKFGEELKNSCLFHLRKIIGKRDTSGENRRGYYAEVPNIDEDILEMSDCSQSLHHNADNLRKRF